MNINNEFIRFGDIHGHSLVDYPQMGLRDVNINISCDFGAYLTGILTDAVSAVLVKWWMIGKNCGVINENLIYII